MPYAWSYPFYGYPYVYRYPYGYSYGYPYPYTTYAPPEVAVQPVAPSPQPSVRREFVYPNGKYVLYGDGMTEPWQWVWVPAAPSAPPAPPAPPAPAGPSPN